MTREELIIEEKVQQLYANTPNWPQIPQDEMSQLCEQLLAADTVKRITMKQVVKYGEIDKKSYKEYCSGCLFETLLSVLNNYDPSQGKFIPYFSRYFKLNLQHELLEETDDDSHGKVSLPDKKYKSKGHTPDFLYQQVRRRNDRKDSIKTRNPGGSLHIP